MNLYVATPRLRRAAAAVLLEHPRTCVADRLTAVAHRRRRRGGSRAISDRALRPLCGTNHHGSHSSDRAMASAGDRRRLGSGRVRSRRRLWRRPTGRPGWDSRAHGRPRSRAVCVEGGLSRNPIEADYGQSGGGTTGPLVSRDAGCRRREPAGCVAPAMGDESDVAGSAVPAVPRRQCGVLRVLKPPPIVVRVSQVRSRVARSAAGVIGNSQLPAGVGSWGTNPSSRPSARSASRSCLPPTSPGGPPYRSRRPCRSCRCRTSSDSPSVHSPSARRTSSPLPWTGR